MKSRLHCFVKNANQCIYVANTVYYHQRSEFMNQRVSLSSMVGLINSLVLSDYLEQEVNFI